MPEDTGAYARSGPGRVGDLNLYFSGTQRESSHQQRTDRQCPIVSTIPYPSDNLSTNPSPVGLGSRLPNRSSSLQCAQRVAFLLETIPNLVPIYQ